jgi:glycosyltransferase involved in cell wall biosynthesis
MTTNPTGQHTPDRRVRTTSADEPLVSIMLHGYAASRMERCLDSIFEQRHIRHFEVIICDDASSDGSWEIANRYAERFAGKVTISRNNQSLGRNENRGKALQLCKGKYQVELTGITDFEPAYVQRAIERMEEDVFLEHSYITRLQPGSSFLPTARPERRTREHERTRRPLVSVCVYNFNYGRYLRQCLGSVFAQTYDNVELCFSDNASTDDSWRIALEFAERHPGKISLTRNRVNFGPSVNLWHCSLNVRGKYILKLCSDDAIRPEFIERCVAALEDHPDAAFAMVHRDIIDEHGNTTAEAPFYDRSCLIPGAEQAAVYMMSSVNPSISQILYNTERQETKRMAGNLNDRWFGDRLMDFHICCDSPVVYIKDPLLLNRVHGGSDGARMEGNLLQCVGEFVLLHQLADIAETHSHMEKARGRLQPAIAKLASLCMRYCVRLLAAGDEGGARRYFHLSRAIHPDIEKDGVYERLGCYWTADAARRGEVLGKLLDEANLVKRASSYPPPPGSMPLGPV